MTEKIVIIFSYAVLWGGIIFLPLSIILHITGHSL